MIQNAKYENDYYAQLNGFNYSFGNLVAYYGTAKKLEKNLLQPYGLTMFDDFSNIKREPTPSPTTSNGLKRQARKYLVVYYQKDRIPPTTQRL